ncbi:oxidoreductase NAD-binding Rossmann fold protein [Enterococcus phoeniculicola]|jgi:predicted dehydrogenase|uniref:Oxidoreductase NAD-binding Rossmann fold protein n=1 Tax=Enterococcus phoeniculicola ATCC BAA-412 TaxID=1158610 RepID=R3U698_9ENTE|nr:Gfo/Idh/MocA family oxidoreductase [Enterococcus phoeniculicola]EOL48948.1 oxidoreductase NAD-binding Rossmann fold protein [Enterococcus phoeniculicola ATCC BAA-412]EOT72794.1 oxidoreductase NAD-binding Rossmann fold protein [Enterococcus phoeniculicola ATCC BAA-412]OJG70842.1 oxidoreductase NAD-binding Rossmann fold protein [Enterococcus phoeniculicola]
MINLGIIGTNWISGQFVEAALSTGEYELTAVYSRKLATAQAFGEPFGEVEYATDLHTFFGIQHMDTVYIASPNSLHFGHAKEAILAGKNVIVEKPAFSTPEEMDEIISLANEQHVFFFEAARNFHEKGFQKVRDLLPLKNEILGASFTYMKYSSRYDQVLDGGEPNIFSPHFSGGALMDLGVYLVYTAVAWFGMPNEVHYFARKVSTGVDGLGWGILRYDLFDVTIQPGKIGDSYATSEVYFDKGTLVLNGVNAIEDVVYHDRNLKQREKIEIHPAENPMAEEALNFAKVISHPTDSKYGILYEEWVELARNVNQVIYDLRKSAGIIFDADSK